MYEIEIRSGKKDLKDLDTERSHSLPKIMQVVKSVLFAYKLKKKLGLQDWTEIWFWDIGLICAMLYLLMGFPVHLGLL